MLLKLAMSTVPMALLKLVRVFNYSYRICKEIAFAPAAPRNGESGDRRRGVRGSGGSEGRKMDELSC